MSETQPQQPQQSLGTKLVALFGVSVVISFAAIIAGVPINIPSRQTDTQPNVNSGSNAWQIVATAFVFGLSPALAFAYGTLHGLNLSDLLRNVTVVVSLISFLWIIFSFSLSYGKDAKENGILGYPSTFYFFYHTQDETAWLNNAGTVSNSIFAVYELGFALVTAVLVTISLAGRVNLNSFLIFIAFWHLVVYTPVAHMVWTPSGVLNTNWVQDFSGALVVHILSSTTSLAVHLLLGKDEIRRAGPVADSEGALSYTLLVWFLWFGFNAGKAYNPGPVATQSVVNTIAATYISVLIAYFYNTILDKPFTNVSISNAVLIGVVGITPASGYVTVGGALVIAIFTYLFTIAVTNFFVNEGNGKNESLSTVSIHSIAGTVGFIWTAILSYEFVNPEGYNGLTSGRGVVLGYQLAALVAIWVGTFLSNFILAWLVNLWAPLKTVDNWGPVEQEQQQQVVEGEGEQNKAV